MNQELDTTLKTEIGRLHQQAEVTTSTAKAAINQAINERIMCASLVEKAKQMHKQDLAGFLRDELDGNAIKTYLSIHDAAQKRAPLADKRQLIMHGILDKGQPTRKPGAEKKPPPSAVTVASKMVAGVNQLLKRRPVSEMTPGEVEQVEFILRPVADFINELRNR